MPRRLIPSCAAQDSLPVGSAIRAARAASASPLRSNNVGSELQFALLSRPSSVDGRHSRPGSADSRNSAVMASAPRLLMSPNHPRRGARGDGSLGPLNKEDQELESVCRQISDLAPQKFTTVREAFRYLKPDRNGMVNRSDIFYFLRAYGVQAEQASRIYKRFDPDENGSINCCQFVNFMRPHVAPNGEDMESMAGLTTEAPRRTPASPCPDRMRPRSQARSAHEVACPQVAIGSDVVDRISKEFQTILHMVREKAPQRFAHAREALRIVDVDYDGCITRGEMQNFFRSVGVNEKESDRFYDMLAGGGIGGANYHSFVQIVGPYLDLPGVITATQRSASRSSRPDSANNRGRSTPRRFCDSDENCQRLVVEEEHEGSRTNTGEAQKQKQCLEDSITPPGAAKVQESPRRLKPCEGRIATPSPTPRQLKMALAKEARCAAQAARPASPSLAVKKGGQRPLGIQRKTFEKEGCPSNAFGALCTADGRPVATPARRLRSTDSERCQSPQVR